MQKLIVAALLLLLFLPSCMVVHHSVGNAPPKKAPNTQTYSTTHHWFLFWGLIPLNKKQQIPIPSDNYRMRSFSGGVDVLLTILTAGIVSGRTTKITAYRNNNGGGGGGGNGGNNNNTSNCVDEQRFQAGLNNIRSANMQMEKKKIATAFVENNAVSCNQLRIIINQFMVDFMKEEVLIAAYPRCCDKQNFDSVIRSLESSISQDKVRRATTGGGR